ncbi:MAG: LysM peptidoglycan-binding domain-containing protein [Thermoleophilaceae bacterium]
MEPGETLWSIAAASNLTTRTLAAANSLSEGSAVVTGSTITVPREGEGTAALAAGGTPSGGTATGATAAPPPAGAYTVQPGDTLSGIAARAGVSSAAVAAMNGLAPGAQVVSGTALKLPTGSVSARSAAATGGTAGPAAPSAPPSATPGRVGAAQIGQIAAQNGVSSSLAAAIAWQESGFDNGMVSSANARGVMQVMPGTWSWVQSHLAGRRLDPSSAQDNVHAGTLYLSQLLRDAGGDPTTAIAGYYQGPASIRSIGMLPETRRYVDNVMALRGRFGG